jgi:hypothetical protein
LKNGQCKLDNHQNFDDYAQRYAGLSFAIHSEKTGVLSPENVDTHLVGTTFLHFHGITSH